MQAVRLAGRCHLLSKGCIFLAVTACPPLAWLEEEEEEEDVERRRAMADLNLSVASCCLFLRSSSAFLLLSSSACAMALFFSSRALESWGGGGRKGRRERGVTELCAKIHVATWCLGLLTFASVTSASRGGCCGPCCSFWPAGTASDAPAPAAGTFACCHGDRIMLY